MKRGATTALGTWGFGQLYYRWQAKRLKKAHQKKSDKLIQSYQQRKEAIVKQFGEAYQTLEVNADYVDSLIAQLENILQHPDTDPNKRKLAEFKLPDANNDNRISRAEVRGWRGVVALAVLLCMWGGDVCCVEGLTKREDIGAPRIGLTNPLNPLQQR